MTFLNWFIRFFSGSRLNYFKSKKLIGKEKDSISIQKDGIPNFFYFFPSNNSFLFITPS